jgi:GNAT superfamily N-acetyltransferase
MDLAEISRAGPAPELELCVVAPESGAARHCLAAYFRELAARFEGGYDPHAGDAAPEAEMRPPDGFFVVARIDGRAVGCGGIRRIGDSCGEIKRMWIAPAARGQGVARRLLHELEALARRAGLDTLRLDTNRVLVEAQALYRRYNDNPYAHHWFEKRLE